MAYTWVVNESITADKLNQAQTHPIMEKINESGLAYTVDNANFTGLNYDSGSDSANYRYAENLTESWAGNVDLKFDYGCNRYKIQSGDAGLSGAVIRDIGTLVKQQYKPEKDWINNPQKKTLAEYMNEYNEWANNDEAECPPPFWDFWNNVQNTEEDPLVVECPIYAVQNIIIDVGTGLVPSSVSTDQSFSQFENIRPMTIPTPPSPSYCSMISTKPGNTGNFNKIDAKISVKSVGNKKIFDVKNTNSPVVWPVVRPAGFRKESELDFDSKIDIKDRLYNSSWVPTVDPTVTPGQAVIPALSIGETGGIFVDKIVDKGSIDLYSIGIGAGVEFYDSNTISHRNISSTRPNSTTAKVDFGSGGKYGYIQISSVNERPWQFQLSGHFDPGSSFKPDPGTCGSITICKAQGPICYQGAGYYGWIGRGSTPTQALKEGIIDGSITRLTNGANLYCGKYSDIYYAYRPGEIIDGGIGIATAKFEWTSSYNKNSPTDGEVIANNHGGLVTGIVNDSPCRAYIDDNGFIHLPNPEWMGKYGIKIPCANNPLAPDGNPQNSYHIAEGNMCLSCSQLDWAKAYAPNCDGYKCGIVNGKVCTMSFDDDISFKYVYPTCKAKMTSRIGDVANGTIRLGVSKFSSRYGTMVSANTDWNLTTKNNDWGIQWRPSGGILRGIKNDIWINCVPDPNKPGTYHYMPYSLPFIDTWGVLHLPQWHISYEENGCFHKIHVWTGRCGIPKYPNGIGWTSNALPPANDSSGPDNNWGQSKTGGTPIKRT